MGLFDRFKKSKANKQMERLSFDRMEYHFDEAHRRHITLKDKDVEALTEEEELEIVRRAGTHIGFFLTWIIKHHFEGEIYLDEQEALEAVRREEMLGIDFLMEYGDGKFIADDVSEEILPFVDSYYDKYLTVFNQWVVNELHDLPLEFVGSWEDYHQFEHILDEAYAAYCKE